MNHSVKGKAVMQGIKRRNTRSLGLSSVKQEESRINYGGTRKSKVIPLNSLLVEGRGICFLGPGEEVSREESVTVGEK